MNKDVIIIIDNGSAFFNDIYSNKCSYSILWPDFMWYTGMWSLNGDQSGQWRSINMTSQWTLINDIRMGNDVARDIHCDVTMSNDIAMCTYHGITMHNDIAMNLFYYVISTLCLIMILLWNKN